MGQYLLSPANQSPLTLQHCLVDEHIDLSMHYYYKCSRDEYDQSINFCRTDSLKKRTHMKIDISITKKVEEEKVSQIS